uniref:Uncharacterized protein n=1 Tax=Cannabis sativa TaxID=3483 RepID=A0A803R0T9_CANSA
MDRLEMFLWTIWGLQERRFSITFDVVSSVMVSITTSLMLCFISLRRHRGLDFLSAMPYAYS